MCSYLIPEHIPVFPSTACHHPNFLSIFESIYIYIYSCFVVQLFVYTLYYICCDSVCSVTLQIHVSLPHGLLFGSNKTQLLDLFIYHKTKRFLFLSAPNLQSHLNRADTGWVRKGRESCRSGDADALWHALYTNASAFKNGRGSN